MHDLIKNIKKIFTPTGTLSQKLPEFEPRPGQLDMALAIAQCFENGTEVSFEQTKNMLAVEAETGIGKTLAYLIPAILSGQKVVISTGTLNLQEQILSKEIPFIKKHFAPDLSALCVKGRQNYLCLYRWHQLSNSPQLPLFENDHLDALADWLESTRNGDRAELDWLPDNSPLWREITANSSQCLGMHCPDNAQCFISRLRRQSARSQVLIVNHHLFFSDLALRRSGFAEVLPRYESVIFDEAHHIENVATRYFGTSISHYQFLDLAQDTLKLCDKATSPEQVKAILATAKKLASHAARFLKIFPGERGRFPLSEAIQKIHNWQEECLLLDATLVSFTNSLESQAKISEIWSSLQRRAEELRLNFRSLTGEQLSSHVYWYERREKTITLSASPIEIAGVLQESFYAEIKTAVFTSATLTTNGKFNYLFDRLGLPQETETLRLASPFDYPGRTKLFVPNNIHEPAHPAYFKEVQETIHHILEASSGRALVLFTSLKAMHSLEHYLEGKLAFPLFVQGSAPKQKLIENFSSEKHSVLLAVASFWEGVNIPGETLSCVIIDKLPFEVPSDPVIMARINKIKEDGGNPFIAFQIPRAILTLRQGVGRLMRSTTDSGLLAIMDVRLFTKQYGKLFLKSLPKSPLTRDMDDVRIFFEEITHK